MLLEDLFLTFCLREETCVCLALYWNNVHSVFLPVKCLAVPGLCALLGSELSACDTFSRPMRLHNVCSLLSLSVWWMESIPLVPNLGGHQSLQRWTFFFKEKGWCSLLSLGFLSLCNLMDVDWSALVRIFQMLSLLVHLLCVGSSHFAFVVWSLLSF